MPAANETVRAALAAFERQDADAFASCFDTDGELLLPRNLIEGGSYRGHDRIKQAVADAYATWESIRFELRSVEEKDDAFVVRAGVTNSPRTDAPTIEYEATYLCRLRDGRIAHFRPLAG